MIRYARFPLKFIKFSVLGLIEVITLHFFRSLAFVSICPVLCEPKVPVVHFDPLRIRFYNEQDAVVHQSELAQELNVCQNARKKPTLVSLVKHQEALNPFKIKQIHILESRPTFFGHLLRHFPIYDRALQVENIVY